MTTTDFELRPTLITWEKLRIAYNVVLLCVVAVVVIIQPEILTIPTLPFRLVVAAVGANVCFTAGPLAEAYVSCLANRRVALTWFLFIPGLLFAVLIAASFMATAVMLDD